MLICKIEEGEVFVIIVMKKCRKALYLLDQMVVFYHGSHELPDQTSMAQLVFVETKKEEALISFDDAPISLHAMVGNSNPRTMCVHGFWFINKKLVVVLIET